MARTKQTARISTGGNAPRDHLDRFVPPPPSIHPPHQIDFSTGIEFQNALRRSLKHNGFAVINNVLDQTEVKTGQELFHKWYKSDEQIARLHPKLSTRGIFKHFGIGGSTFLWFTRTQDNVASVYRAAHGLSDNERMITSLDGACYIPREWKNKDAFPSRSFVHTDQKPADDSFCVQGYVAYTDNPSNGRTTIFYRGSHKLFNDYYAEFKDQAAKKKQWNKIDIPFLQRPEIEWRRLSVTVPAGSMCVWDSKTFHSTKYGSIHHERLVAYVCMLPKALDTDKMSKKRKKYASIGRTTSHWPIPIGVNGEHPHPRVYKKDDVRLDYDNLPLPGFNKFAKKARMLL